MDFLDELKQHRLNILEELKKYHHYDDEYKTLRKDYLKTHNKIRYYNDDIYRKTKAEKRKQRRLRSPKAENNH